MIEDPEILRTPREVSLATTTLPEGVMTPAEAVAVAEPATPNSEMPTTKSEVELIEPPVMLRVPVAPTPTPIPKGTCEERLVFTEPPLRFMVPTPAPRPIATSASVLSVPPERLYFAV